MKRACGIQTRPPRWWTYRPQRHWYGWKSLRPFWFGNDEYHRKTLVVGWNETGQIIIALWHFRSSDCREDECGPVCPDCSRMMYCRRSVWYCPRIDEDVR